MIVIKENLTLQELLECSPYFTRIDDAVMIFVNADIYELVEHMYLNVPSIRIQRESESIRNSLKDAGIAFTSKNSFFNDMQTYKQSLFASHWGIGDMINLNGAINFLSQGVDEIYVICYKSKKNIALQLYELNKKVRPLIIESEESISPGGQIPPKDVVYITPLFHFFFTYFKIIHLSGILNPKSIFWKQNWLTLPPPPWLFYEDLQLPHETKYKYQLLPKTENSVRLQNIVTNTPYVFVHQKCSVSSLNLVSWDIQAILTLNPDENMYKKEDAFYNQAQEFVNQNIFDYIPIIQNAKELYMIDSSFSCLALYCKPLKAEKKYCYRRDTKDELVDWFDTP